MESLRRDASTLLSSSFVRNGIWLILKSGAGAGIGFLFWLVAARIYSPAAVGTGSAIVSIVRLLAILSIGGIEFAIIRYYSQTRNTDGLVTSAILTSSLIALLTSSVYLIGQPIWTPNLDLVRAWPLWILIPCAAVIAVTADMFTRGVFIGARESNVSFLQQTAGGLRIPSLAIPGSGAVVIVVAMTFGLVAEAGLGLLAAARRGIRPSLSLPRIDFREAAAFSGKNHMARLLEEFPPLLLPVFVISTLGEVKTAHFFVAWSIAFLTIQIPRSTAQSLFAEGASGSEDYDYRIFFGVTWGILAVAVLGGIAFGKWVLLPFGESYQQATTLLRILLIAALPYPITAAFSARCRVEDRMSELIALYGLMNIVLFGGSFVLISTGFDLLGVGYAWGAANAVAAGAAGLRLRKLSFSG